MAVILAAPTNHILYPNLYMMDTSFEAFGLLATVCVAADLHQRTRRTATHAAIATVALFLIKPAALVFLAPLYLWIAWQLRAVFLAPNAGTQPSVRRLAPYLIMGGVIALLFISPYGRAVVDQYRLGMTG